MNPKIYNAILYSLLPFVLLRLLWRSMKAPKYRQRLKERFAFFDQSNLDIFSQQPIWIHAVSVGEVIAIAPIVRKLQDLHPTIPVIITTTTPTGSERVKNLFDDDVFHVYFPYDLPFVVQRFIKKTNPCVLVMVETEIWPNLLSICKQQGIVTILANARLSEKSAKGYARLGQFGRDIFSKIGIVGAQDELAAQRFIQCGAKKDQVHITGSIKYDIHLPASLSEQAQVLRLSWGLDRPVWVGASTHEQEEEILLNIHQTLKTECPNVLLVLIPRHPERFDRVARLIEKKKLKYQRRSKGLAQPEDEVYLADSMGEVPLFLSAADVAFVGGSLIERGGHNILEPAALGIPVLFGQHMFNFQAISQLILEKKAGKQVKNQQELTETVKYWLSNANIRAEIGENARKVVSDNAGAFDKLYLLIEQTLDIPTL